MRPDIAEEYLVEHYPTSAERAADGWVHGVALACAGFAAFGLVAAASATGRAGLVAAAAVYAVALIAMLACSALYNLTRISPARPVLRRLDEAAIFLMIAASYTPFTTQRFSGAWAWGMTLLVWSFAALGIAGKLLAPRISERIWTLAYLAFGWVAVIAVRPLISGVSIIALALLAVGGLLYMTGAFIFLRKTVAFRRAIWHGFVAAGAAVQYAAILLGVVLQPHL